MPDKDQNQPKNNLVDVAGPGNTPALATSRPIIVKHGSMATRDPMMVDDNAKDEAETASEQSNTRELKIQPDQPEDDKAEAPAVVESSPEENLEEQDDTSVKQPEPDANENASSETGAVDSLMNEVDTKQADKKQKRALDEHVKELEKVIATKEFFVPIGIESRRRSTMRVLLVLILLLVLGLAGLNFAIDAELTDIGVPALTDLL